MMAEPYWQSDDGRIIIYCARCEDVMPSVDPASVSLVLCDPPYGIGFDTDLTRFNTANNRTWDNITDDDKSFDPTPLLSFGRCVIFGGNYYVDRLPLGRWIVWNKRDAMRTGMLLADAEMAWHNCGGRPVRVFNWYWNGCYRTGEMGKAFHPAQKPVALMRWILDDFTAPGDMILDPYMGSGPIAKACQESGRCYIGIEIEERYCKIAVRRLSQQVLPFAAQLPVSVTQTTMEVTP